MSWLRRVGAAWPWVGVIAIVALVGGLVLALWRPLPPRSVVMVTGPETGAYDALGRGYLEILKRDGIHLELLATRGSVDNVELLCDPDSNVSVALVQGGASKPEASCRLSTLGTVSYEPVWVLQRKRNGDRPGEFLAEGRISIGAPGSGTRQLAQELLPAIGMDFSRAEILDIVGGEAGEALLHGELEMMLVVGAWESPLVRRLLGDDSIELLSWTRADAHVALRPYLSKLVLPRGVADLARDRPPADVVLVATKTSLVVRQDLHPAVKFVLLEAASEIHGGAGIFRSAGRFPAPEPIDVPLDEHARQYYRSGIPFLQRYLPFWLAASVARLVTLLIPIVGVLYPVFRLLPAAYDWAMRRRIYRLYGELKFVEAELGTGGHDSPMLQFAARLDELERRVNQMRVPGSYQHMLYRLRTHIGLVRDQLAHIRPSPEKGSSRI